MCERNIDQLPLTSLQLGTWPVTQACALSRNRTSNRLVHRMALNPLSHTSQGQASSIINILYKYSKIAKLGSWH